MIEDVKNEISEVLEWWSERRLADKVTDVAEIAAFVWLAHFAMNIVEFVERIPEMAADATLQQVAEIALISTAFNLLIIGYVMYYVFTRHLAPLLGFTAEAIADAWKEEDGVQG